LSSLNSLLLLLLVVRQRETTRRGREKKEFFVMSLPRAMNIIKKEGEAAHKES
jgi:hypothetical protein